MPKRLVIIDGKSVFYRGYYAMPYLSTADGAPTGGVFGFTSLALELFKKLNPDYVAVAWDKAKTNIRKRREIYPAYKEGRKPAPPDFYQQIPMLHELLQAFSWPLYELDDYEADDIMGALAAQAEKEGIEVCLISSDLDLLQIVSPLTHMYAMKKGLANIELFNNESFEKKYDISVSQFLDLKALKGDSSDNLPGVPGIGEKTAIELLKQYHDLDTIYAHLDDIKPAVQKKLIEGKDKAYLTKQVGRIWIDAPVTLDLKSMDVRDLDVVKLKELLQKFEFKSLLTRLPEYMNDVATDEAALVATQYEPTVIHTMTAEAKKKISEAKHVVVMPIDGRLLVSIDKREAYSIDVEQLKSINISKASIISYDTKPILKLFLDIDAQDLPSVHHDIRQAAFLINSLTRSKNFSELAGVDLADDDGSVSISAAWHIYNEQVEALKKMPKVKSVAEDIDFPSIAVLAKMEHKGIILDVTFLADMEKMLGTEINKLTKNIYKAAGREFNINSPSQLAEVLFITLALPTAGVKKGKTGYSTGIRELEKLRGKHEIIDFIEQYRELTKLESTYVRSLPKLVDSNNRLHTTFNQDVAATGRLSSTDPNLQNIPISTELGRRVRQAFVPDKGNVFISADYSQFELRLAAVLADDKELIADFNHDDMDIHTKTASDVYGVALEDVTKVQRRAAKVINFGILYGMSPHGLAAATGMTFSEAKHFIDEYFRLRQPIRAYIDNTLKMAKDVGYVETLFGRRRPSPDVNSNNYIVREAAKRAAANMPIQGTEADLMKIAMLEVESKLGSLGWQVLQIHDSILVECPESNAEQVSGILKSTMEGVYPKLGVRLKVDVSVGKHWGEV